jgi:hypothetical protein
MRFFLILCIIGCSGILSAQKKVMQHEDKALWNRIRNVNISNSGEYVLYGVDQEEQDQTIQLMSSNGNPIFSYERTKGGAFSHDSKFIGFSVNAWKY